MLIETISELRRFVDGYEDLKDIAHDLHRFDVKAQTERLKFCEKDRHKELLGQAEDFAASFGLRIHRDTNPNEYALYLIEKWNTESKGLCLKGIPVRERRW